MNRKVGLLKNSPKFPKVALEIVHVTMYYKELKELMQRMGFLNFLMGG